MASKKTLRPADKAVRQLRRRIAAHLETEEQLRIDLAGARNERDQAIYLRNATQVDLTEAKNQIERLEKDLAEACGQISNLHVDVKHLEGKAWRLQSIEDDYKSLREALRKTREALVEKHMLLRSAVRIIDDTSTRAPDEKRDEDARHATMALLREALQVDMPAQSVSDGSDHPWGARSAWQNIVMATAGMAVAAAGLWLFGRRPAGSAPAPASPVAGAAQ